MLTTVLTTQFVFTHFFAIFRKNQGFAADMVFKRKNTPKPPFLMISGYFGAEDGI